MGRRSERCRSCATRLINQRNHVPPEHRRCPDCGTGVSVHNLSGRCRPCAQKNRNDRRPALVVLPQPDDAVAMDKVRQIERERDDAILSRSVLVRACQELQAERDLLKMQVQLLVVRLRDLEDR